MPVPGSLEQPGQRLHRVGVEPHVGVEHEHRVGRAGPVHARR